MSAGRFGAAPQSTEAPVNTARESRSIRRPPKRSSSQAEKGIIMPRQTGYTITTASSAAAVSWNWRAILGRATVVMAPSTMQMKVMDTVMTGTTKR